MPRVFAPRDRGGDPRRGGEELGIGGVTLGDDRAFDHLPPFRRVGHGREVRAHRRPFRRAHPNGQARRDRIEIELVDDLGVQPGEFCLIEARRGPPENGEIEGFG